MASRRGIADEVDALGRLVELGDEHRRATVVEHEPVLGVGLIGLAQRAHHVPAGDVDDVDLPGLACPAPAVDDHGRRFGAGGLRVLGVTASAEERGGDHNGQNGHNRSKAAGHEPQSVRRIGGPTVIGPKLSVPMPEIALAAESGRVTGSRSSSRLRHSGRIPGVVYGHGTDPLSISIEARALRNALSTDAGLNALLEIQVDGAKHLTLAKAIQRHPVRNTVLHVDFQIVRRDEIMTVDVPINLIGEAVELHRAEGIVDQQLHALTLQTTPDKIPTHLEVDITNLLVGDTIRVSDIALPPGV